MGVIFFTVLQPSKKRSRRDFSNTVTKYPAEVNEKERVNLAHWPNSHPLTEDRIERVDAQARELSRQGKGRNLKIQSDEYIARLDGLVFGPGEKDGVIEENLYRNRYHRFSISSPKAWKIERGDAGSSLIMKHPTREFYCQTLVSELQTEMAPTQFTRSLKRSGDHGV